MLISFLLVLTYDCFDSVRYKKIFFYFFCAILVVVSSIRYRVGIDTIAYMETFDQLPTLSDLNFNYFSTTRYQPLWILYSSFIKSTFGHFVFLQFCNSLIVNVSVFIFVQKYSRLPFFTIFLYVVLFYLELNFEIMRESIAISIFLCAIPYLLKKKYIIYYLLIFAAYEFHVSAVICLIVPIFINIRFSNVKLLLLLCIATFLPFLFNSIFNTMLTIATGNLFEYTTAYGDATALIDKGLNINGYLFALISVFIAPLLFIILGNHLYASKYFGLIYLMLILGLFTIVLPIFNRFINYIFIIYLVYFSELIYFISKKYLSIQRVTCLSIVILFLFAKPVYRNFTSLDAERLTSDILYYERYWPYESYIDCKESEVREFYYRQIVR